MSSKNKRIIWIIFFVALFAGALFLRQKGAFADTGTDLAQKKDQQAQLELQLQQIEDQIAQYEQQLSGITSQKNTLQNKIKQLKTQQAKLSLQIQATNISIQNLEVQLQQTESDIDAHNHKISSLRTQMSQIMLNLYERGNSTLVEMLAADGGIQGFFNEYNSYQQLTAGLASILTEVQAENAKLQQTQQQLSDQHDQQQNFIQIVQLQNKQLSQTIGDQNQLLKDTKGKEANYQAVLNDSRAQAAQIRSRIYDLFGISQQITFGQAATIAKFVSSQTGVRAAFLLAILTQESSLGKNVGTCNRPGDPPSKSWRVVMKPDRDQAPFQQITADLGMDPDITPVSCPMRDSSGNQIGWGGAMGPAQFIPSTWVGYKDKVSAITGKAANPWDIRDAFIAAAIKLKADGGASQSGEWTAAMKYFSGSTNSKYSFYGDNVVATAAKYQQDLDALGN